MGVNNPGVQVFEAQEAVVPVRRIPTNSFAGGAGGNAFCEIWEYE
jgi:hypothetical protein